VISRVLNSCGSENRIAFLELCKMPTKVGGHGGGKTRRRVGSIGTYKSKTINDNPE